MNCCGQRDVLGDEFDRPLPRPAVGVQAGVHDEACRAEQLGRHRAQLCAHVAVEAELVRQPLCVQPPALGVDGVRELLQQRQLRDELLPGELRVVPGDRLVERDRLEVPPGAGGRADGVEPVRPRSAVLRLRTRVVRRHPGLRDGRRHRFDRARFGQRLRHDLAAPAPRRAGPRAAPRRSRPRGCARSPIPARPAGSSPRSVMPIFAPSSRARSLSASIASSPRWCSSSAVSGSVVCTAIAFR